MAAYSKLVKKLTLAEKASLCSGKNFWNTQNIEKYQIPGFMVTDGPHGLRKQGGSADHLGLSDSVPATCFPTAAGLAASWNRELMEGVGRRLAHEAGAEDVAVLLGPGINIKRSPLCGRNFEYFSEDPYVSSEMASAYIHAVQKEGIGTSLKHFAVNNQEYHRLTVDARVDERTLHEIYLAAFEATVQNSQPWSVMCSYNKVNGVFASENHRLLTELLRDTWGFEGFVVSDWGAVNERVAGLKAGMDLEMPSSGGVGDKAIQDAVEEGTLDEAVLDRTVERMLAFADKAEKGLSRKQSVDKKEHHDFAVKTAAESMVLLKNEDVLPLQASESVAVIGEFAEQPRFQGGGSSKVNPAYLDIPLEQIKKTASADQQITYARGFHIDRNDTDDALMEEALAAAKAADKVVVYAGLPDRYESEGYDRTHLQMPANQAALIEELGRVHDNVVVLLSNGAPIEMPWLDSVKGVVECYLGGQGMGQASADILFGKVNPSGKLAETFPMTLQQNPSYLHFPGNKDSVMYGEGLYVGYRYYDAKEETPLFPFGYGLSYTTFSYSNLRIDQPEAGSTNVTVTCTITNTGSTAGKETAQLYVKDQESSLERPERELKGFTKVRLEPGESKDVTFELNERSFAYYHDGFSQWIVEPGTFTITVGASSRDLRLHEEVDISKDTRPVTRIHRNSRLGELAQHPDLKQVLEKHLAELASNNLFAQQMVEEGGTADPMMEAMMKEMPLRGLINFSSGHFTEQNLNDLIEACNIKIN